MSDIFNADSIFWLITTSGFAGLFGFSMTYWLMNRFWFMKWPPRARVITVWRNHEIIYDKRKTPPMPKPPPTTTMFPQAHYRDLEASLRKSKASRLPRRTP